MNDNKIVVALDVGTTKVCTLIGTAGPDGLEVVGVGSYPSYGLKKGSVVNIDKTVQSIRNSLAEAKMMAGIEDIDIATIGIAGNHIYCFNSSGVVPC
jgi:cell division protein FtsA